MTEPVWLHPDLVRAVHGRQIAEHGGTPGVRDHNLLDSALARAQHVLAYGGPEMDIPALAAAYAAGIARNHPFVDGNKRSAYIVCRTFLILNGWDFAGSSADRYSVFVRMASGEIDEEAFIDWLRGHTRPESVNEAPGRYSRS